MAVGFGVVFPLLSLGVEESQAKSRKCMARVVSEALERKPSVGSEEQMF